MGLRKSGRMMKDKISKFHLSQRINGKSEASARKTKMQNKPGHWVHHQLSDPIPVIIDGHLNSQKLKGEEAFSISRAYDFLSVHTLILLAFLLYFATAQGQVGIGTTTPDASAILDLTSTTKGMLISRVTVIQRDAITSPATGLLVYQTDNSPGYYYNAGTPGVPNWVRFFSGSGAGGWDLTGNSGTTVGTNFLGTTDAEDFAIFTNNVERIKVKANGLVGIGIQPNERLTIGGGGINIDSDNNGDYAGIGEVAGGLFLSGQGYGNLAYDVFVAPSGNLGVGTIAPATNLHINSDPAVQPVPFGSETSVFISSYATGAGIQGQLGSLWFGGGEGAGADANNDAAGIAGYAPSDYTATSGEGELQFYTTPAGSITPSERMRIKSNGNVGIGTTNPTERLESKGSGVGLYLNQTTAADLYIRYHVPGIRWWTVGPKANGDFWFSNSQTHSGSVAMEISTGGNVGIGTTTPEAKLTVAPGLVGASTIGGTSMELGVHLKPISGRSGYTVEATNSYLSATSNNAGFYYVHPFDAANAVIGYKVFRIRTGTEVGAADNPTLGMSDRFFVTKGGNAFFDGSVGIGTTTPGEKLDVVGNIAVSGTVDGVDISVHVADPNAHHSLPTSLPPSGVAGGDLSGTYPNPAVVDDSHSHTDGTVSNTLTIGNASTITLNTASNVAEGGLSWNAAGNRLKGGIGASVVEFYSGPHATSLAHTALTGVTANQHHTPPTLGSLGGVAGSGTLNYLPKWTPDGSTLGNSLIFDNGTNIGIGTTSPLDKLHMVGVIRLPAGAGNLVRKYANVTETIVSTRRTDESQEGLFRSDGWGNFTFNKSVGIGYTLGSSQAGNLLVSNNVGIGTPNPGAKLHLLSSSALEQRIMQSATGALVLRRDGAIAYVLSESGVVANRELAFGSQTSAGGTIQERMRIDKDGNIGIGTASPAAKLDVSGTTSGILIPRVTLVQRNAIVTPVTSELVFQTDNTPGYYYWDGAAWISFLTGSGGGGGWSTTGDAGTTVGTNFLGTTDAQDFAIYTNNTEKMRITTAGNVGIGITSPDTKLDIKDNVNYTGTTPNASSYAGSFGQTGSGMVGIGRHNGQPALQGMGTGTSYNLVLNPAAGNVGIGTTSPNEKLEVAGNVTINPSEYTGLQGGLLSVFESNTVTALKTYATAKEGFSLDSYVIASPFQGVVDLVASRVGGVGVGGSMFRLFTQSPGTGTIPLERMKIDENGNVGIGVTNPGYRLDVLGTTNSRGFRFQDEVGGHINADGALYRFSGQAYLTVDDNFFIRDNVSSGMIDLRPDGNTYFNNNGNVGIGTTTPGQKLTVKGNIYGYVDAGFAVMEMRTSSDGIEAAHFIARRSRGTLAAPTYVQTGNTIGVLDFRNHTNGVGARVISAATENHNAGAAGADLTFSTVPNGSNSTVARITITDNGDVGIGTASPAQELDVIGDVQFSAALMPGGNAGTSGQVLTSQGAGLPPIWQAASGGGAATEITNEIDDSGNPCVGTGCGSTNKNMARCAALCGDLVYNGKSDWRIPSVEEIVSLVNIAPNPVANKVWTCTSANANSMFNTVTITSSNALSMSIETMGNFNRCRCVR